MISTGKKSVKLKEIREFFRNCCWGLVVFAERKLENLKTYRNEFAFLQKKVRIRVFDRKFLIVFAIFSDIDEYEISRQNSTTSGNSNFDCFWKFGFYFDW